jgi:hypothetical protein
MWSSPFSMAEHSHTIQIGDGPGHLLRTSSSRWCLINTPGVITKKYLVPTTKVFGSSRTPNQVLIMVWKMDVLICRITLVSRSC